MIILMGIAGSGKGTQGHMLADALGLQYVSTGDMLRHYATHEQKERMLRGELLGDQEIITMLEAVMATAADPRKILLDGFPRSIAQAAWLLEQVKEDGFAIDHVFHLNVPREVVHERLVKRGREDDTEEAIEYRFKEFENNTVPILDYLKEQGVPVHEIDASLTPPEVHKLITAYLN